MQKGSLVVEVYASNAVIPLPDVDVFVTTEDSSALIAKRITNMVGQTERIEIDAPDRNLSETPGNENPFTRVRVYAAKQGYFNMLIEGVQIFATEESLQRIQLIPLPEYLTDHDLTKLIIITPQNL